MNTYKKTLMILAIGFIAIPHVCNAIDEEGNNLINDAWIAYEETFTPFHILNVEKPLSTWQQILAKVNSYVKRNSTILGIADQNLIEDLTETMNANSYLLREIETTRKTNYDYARNRITHFNLLMPDKPNRQATMASLLNIIQSYQGKMNEYSNSFKEIRKALNKVKSQLAAATFNAASKENAREVLLTVIDYTQKAITNAINEISQKSANAESDKKSAEKNAQ